MGEKIKEVYKGYIIEVFPANASASITFKIIEEIKPGKFKTRRVSSCNQYVGKRNQYGEKLYNTFLHEMEAFERAVNYIDNHIVPWAESPNNKANKSN